MFGAIFQFLAFDRPGMKSGHYRRSRSPIGRDLLPPMLQTARPGVGFFAWLSVRSRCRPSAWYLPGPVTGHQCQAERSQPETRHWFNLLVFCFCVGLGLDVGLPAQCPPGPVTGHQCQAERSQPETRHWFNLLVFCFCVGLGLDVGLPAQCPPGPVTGHQCQAERS
jgi:hypothetical protein